MSQPRFDLQVFKTAVAARLATALPDLLGFPDGQALDVPYLPGSDQRAVPYWVLTAGGDTPGDELDIADTVVDNVWGCQVTVAAGMVDDMLSAASRVQAVLYRWRPAIPGVISGPLRPPIGYRPISLLDRTVNPARPYLVLQFQSQNTIT